jgi:hypothetical protein
MCVNGVKKKMIYRIPDRESVNGRCAYPEKKPQAEAKDLS